MNGVFSGLVGKPLKISILVGMQLLGETAGKIEV